jgi:hypothetical protein
MEIDSDQPSTLARAALFKLGLGALAVAAADGLSVAEAEANGKTGHALTLDYRKIGNTPDPPPPPIPTKNPKRPGTYLSIKRVRITTDASATSGAQLIFEIDTAEARGWDEDHTDPADPKHPQHTDAIDGILYVALWFF